MNSPSIPPALTQAPEPAPPRPMIRSDWLYALGCSVILVLYGIVSAVCLLSDWPSAVPSAFHSTGKAGSELSLTIYKFPEHVNMLFASYPLNDDLGLMIIAFLAGVVGSVVHCLGALYRYCGKREFDRSWAFFYVLSPFAGGLLSMGFLWVLRGSLVPSGSAASATSPNGVAGIGFLAGLVSREAIKKLQSIATNVFSTTPPPANSNEAAGSDSSKSGATP